MGPFRDDLAERHRSVSFYLCIRTVPAALRWRTPTSNEIPDFVFNLSDCVWIDCLINNVPWRREYVADRCRADSINMRFRWAMSQPWHRIAIAPNDRAVFWLLSAISRPHTNTVERALRRQRAAVDHSTPYLSDYDSPERDEWISDAIHSPIAATDDVAQYADRRRLVSRAPIRIVAIRSCWALGCCWISSNRNSTPNWLAPEIGHPSRVQRHAM